MHLKRNALSAMILLGLANLAHAVSLGDMTVTSRPGEPLSATLQINDVDVVNGDNQPAIVRVAPPATYLREGVNWPSQAQDLKLVRDADGSKIKLKVEGASDLAAKPFPLLMELNVGGHVTVREYRIEPTATGFAAVGGEVRTSATPVPAAEEKAEKEIKREAVTDPQRASALKKRLAKKGRFAPNVVRDYVALNGFDSTQPFPISRDMTIWSIAKLYWPVYEGATLEQVVVAFRERSPEAFIAGDLSRLVVGSKLVPASTKEVFAVDPTAAFARIHGPDTAMPMSTKNLVDAQSMSLEAAELVARAQNEARRKGGDAMTIARAGREALEEYRARETMNREMRGDDRAGAPMKEGLQYDDAKTTEKTLDTSDKPVEAAQTSTAAPATSEPEGATEETATQAAAAAPEAPAKADAATNETKSADESVPFWRELLSCALILVAAGIFLRRRKAAKAEAAACTDEGCGGEKKGPASVTFQKKIEPASEAQKRAVEATVDACVKNGTTAGAMGAGAQALTDAKIEEARREREAEAAKAAQKPEAQKPADKPKKAAEERIDSPAPGHSGTTTVHGVPTTVSVVFKTPLAQTTSAVKPAGGSALDEHVERPSGVVAHGGASAAAQPWLEPDDEMPPVEKEKQRGVGDVRDIRDIVGDLSLDLDEKEAEVPAVAVPAPEAKPAATPRKSPRERALEDAIEGKLKLAGSFVGLGALKEASELLDEVKRKGNDRQRERALFLENRIKEGSRH